MGILLLVAQIGQIQIMAERELSRGFDRLMTMIENTDKDEYIDKRRDVTDMIELSERVLQPVVFCVGTIYRSVSSDIRRTPPGETKKVRV